MGSSLTPWMSGFSLASSEIGVKEFGDDVKQGSSYYLASRPLFFQAVFLRGAFDEIVKCTAQVPVVKTMQVFLKILPFVIYPVQYLAALYMHGDFDTTMKRFNNWEILPIRLPEGVSVGNGRALSLYARYASDVIQVAFMVSVCVLVRLGGVAFGSGALVAFGVRKMVGSGHLPDRVRLFMESYLPLMSGAGLMMCGGIVGLMGAVSVVECFPRAQNFIMGKIDRVFQKVAGGHSLEEIDAEVALRGDLSFAEINRILDGDDVDFEINPAHCSKEVICGKDLPQDRCFDDYLELFDKAKWDYGLLINKLKRDERFISFLREQYPGRNDFERRVDYYIGQLSDGASKEQFAKGWVRDQLVCLISVLKGDKRIKGSQNHLDRARDDSAKILHYIKGLGDEIGRLKKSRCRYLLEYVRLVGVDARAEILEREREDLLLKMAVEAGNYCGEGILRASGQIIYGNIEKRSVSIADDFEEMVKGKLIDRRREIARVCYQNIFMRWKIMQAYSLDIHTSKFYGAFINLGFSPVTEEVRNLFSGLFYFVWKGFSPFRKRMYQEYRGSLDAVVHSFGRIHFAGYMRRKLENYPGLTEDQKEALIDKFTSGNGGVWDDVETHHRFHRLFFMMQGVLR